MTLRPFTPAAHMRTPMDVAAWLEVAAEGDEAHLRDGVRDAVFALSAMTSASPAILDLHTECNRLIQKINTGAGIDTPGFSDINGLQRKCDAVFAEIAREQS